MFQAERQIGGVIDIFALNVLRLCLNASRKVDIDEQ
jgi:hypothetical protein